MEDGDDTRAAAVVGSDGFVGSAGDHPQRSVGLLRSTVVTSGPSSVRGVASRPSG